MASENGKFRAPATQGQDYGSNPLIALRAQMDRLFDDFFGGRLMRSGSLWDRPFSEEFGFSLPTPRVDLVEKDNEVVVTAELPGIDENEVEVTLEEGGLTIRGEKKSEEKREEGRSVISERRYGSFERRLALPEGIDEDNCSASFDKGVLTVRLKRRPEAIRQAKRIPIGN